MIFWLRNPTLPTNHTTVQYERRCRQRTPRHDENQGRSPAREIGGPHQRAQVNHGRRRGAKRRGRRQLRMGAGVGDQGQAREACSLRAEVLTEASGPSRVAQEPLSSAALRPSGMPAVVQVPGPDVRPRLLEWTRVCLLNLRWLYSRAWEKEEEKMKSLWRVRLCDPMDYSPPGSSIHGTFQARVPEWVAISFSRGSSRPREQMQVSCLAKHTLHYVSHQGSPKCEDYYPKTLIR